MAEPSPSARLQCIDCGSTGVPPEWIGSPRVPDDRPQQLTRDREIPLIGSAIRFAVHLPTGIQRDRAALRIRIDQPDGRNCIAGLASDNGDPVFEGMPGIRRQRSALAGKQLPELRKPRVGRHELPQSADAIRQEQVERRLAACCSRRRLPCPRRTGSARYQCRGSALPGCTLPRGRREPQGGPNRRGRLRHGRPLPSQTRHRRSCMTAPSAPWPRQRPDDWRNANRVAAFRGCPSGRWWRLPRSSPSLTAGAAGAPAARLNLERRVGPAGLINAGPFFQRGLRWLFQPGGWTETLNASRVSGPSGRH